MQNKTRNIATTATLLIALLTLVLVFGNPRTPTPHVSDTASTTQTDRTPTAESPAPATQQSFERAPLLPTDADQQASSSTSVSGNVEFPSQVRTVKLIVENVSYISNAFDDATVLEIMNNMRQQGLVFETTDFPGLGARIDAINGTAAQGGHYWFLYVNGVSSRTGASQAHVVPGDVIEWRYKKSE